MADQKCTTCATRTLSNERAIAMLENAGLRATAPRVILTCLLFCDEKHTHITAEELYEQSIEADCRVSLATVYNTLRAFTAAGILRQVNTDCSRVYFDTDPNEHHHFYDEKTGKLINIGENLLKDMKLPPLPDGTTLKGVDLLVRISS
ncbi:MAG: Fur family transcriptional regulator [Robiginitomaculum sp.]|nr:Fur family transcriptional regulator [Robiginitomaculum sp.]MDQ7076397.1 Fur family transcriptional regulator [Robiginitomaculum sp.]